MWEEKGMVSKEKGIKLEQREGSRGEKDELTR